MRIIPLEPDHVIHNKVTTFPHQNGCNVPNFWALTRVIASKFYVHTNGGIPLGLHSLDVEGRWRCSFVITREEPKFEKRRLRVGVRILTIPIALAVGINIDSVKQCLAKIGCENLCIPDTQRVTSNHLVVEAPDQCLGFVRQTRRLTIACSLAKSEWCRELQKKKESQEIHIHHLTTELEL